MSAVLERIVPPTNGVKHHLITVSEYDRMIEAGVYTENDRIELLNGEIIELMPKGPKHVYFNEGIAQLFREKFGKNVDVRSQNPIILDNFSEPEPDIVLAKPPRKKYLENHPTPTDIFLIMEISDTTLAYDRDAKAQAYSRNGIEQYLLLNLQNETLEDYREPNADGYGAKRTYRSGDVFNLVAFPEIEIKFDDLF
ncbi:MAG TPA: Uma2 family endonuclease [Pyrinomonadaceae bacterium]|nr:Uma2 family endonuclease [Pyrinomonadaceae bacterium]